MMAADAESRDARLVLGLMSGTSADGIDIALIEVVGAGLTRTARFLGGGISPWPNSVAEGIRLAPDWSLEDFSGWHYRLGVLFGAAAKDFLDDMGVPANRIRAIGCHGQTVFHHGGNPKGGTLQAGDTAIVAATAGIPTVGEFRWSDLAVGGQGAPLSPFADWTLHRAVGSSLGILNLGGIANFTLLRGDEAPLGWDCGPANGPLDALARREGLGLFDKDGAFALSGVCVSSLLEVLQAHPFFQKELPRSTGLEEFGEALLLRAEETHQDVASEDLMATFVELAAWAVSHSLEKSGGLEGPIYVCGGGAQNPALMQALHRHLAPLDINSYANLGWDPDLREAVAFALLADAFLENEVSSWPSTTGADFSSPLGRICYPSIP